MRFRRKKSIIDRAITAGFKIMAAAVREQRRQQEQQDRKEKSIDVKFKVLKD